MKEQIIEKDGKKYKVIEIIEDFITIKYKGKEYKREVQRRKKMNNGRTKQKN